MTDIPITCDQVDQLDLDTRYLAGTLGPAEAEAFEAHYFGCERCWALVRQGQEVRAALTGSGVSVTPLRRRRAVSWQALAAGIGVLIAGTALWRVTLRQRPDDVIRGGTPSGHLAVELRPAADTLVVAWTSIAGTAGYRLRLYSSSGDVLVERTTADTTLPLPWAAILAQHGDRLLAQVSAEDRLHAPLARSELTPVVMPGAP